MKAKPAFFKLFLPRYFLKAGQDSQGNHPRHWKQVFISPFASPDDSTVPALKLFEKVPGVRIVTQTTQKALLITAKIETIHGPINYRQRALADHGSIEWTVPYHQVEAGGIRFDGNYRIEKEDGTFLKKVPTILESDVLNGNQVDLGNLP